MNFSSVKALFVKIVNGYHRLQVNAEISEAHKNLKLAEAGYADFGHGYILPLGPEEQQRAIEIAMKQLSSAEQEFKGLEL